MAAWAALLFASAGTVVWPRGWIHLGVWGVTVVVNLAVLLKANRAVLAARLKPRRSTETADRVLLALLLPVTLAIPAVAGWDAVRYRWSPVQAWNVYAGIALHVPGDALLLWTMAGNSVRLKCETKARRSAFVSFERSSVL